MNIVSRSAVVLSLLLAPTAASWAQNSNPGNAGGGHSPLATPDYGKDQPVNPALTTGSRLSVTSTTPKDENPTVPGATGLTVVRGDNSTISGDRRATAQQKAGPDPEDGNR